MADGASAHLCALNEWVEGVLSACFGAASSKHLAAGSQCGVVEITPKIGGQRKEKEAAPCQRSMLDSTRSKHLRALSVGRSGARLASAVAACPVVTLEAQVSRCAQRVFRQARNECADGHLRTISRADAMSFDAWHAPGLVNEERARAMWARVDSIDSWRKVRGEKAST